MSNRSVFLKIKKSNVLFFAGVLALSLLLGVFSAVLDNLAWLRLPAAQRGTHMLTALHDLGGIYADRIAFDISGEIRIKTAPDADWAVFPAGSKTLDLKEEITVLAEDGKTETYTVYDKNPAYLTTQYIPVGEAVQSLRIEAVAPDSYNDSASNELIAAANETEEAAETETAADAEQSAEAAAQNAEAAGSGAADRNSASAAQEAEPDAYPRYDFSGLQFSNYRVINEPRFNPYLFLFACCAGLCLLPVFLKRRYFAERPELAFLLVCLTLGTAMTVSLPRNKVGYDEETHLQAVMDMASLPSGDLHLSDAVLNDLMVTEYNNPNYQPAALEEMQLFDGYLSAYGNYKDGANTPDYYTMPNRMPAYFVMAAALKLAKGLSLSWAGLILIGRLANLVLYAGIMCLAIRKTPAGKFLMLAIALFPQNVFLAATFSYDPFVTGCLFLGMSCLLAELWGSGAPEARSGPAADGKRIYKGSYANLALMLLAFFLGCLPKAVYAPMLLTAFLIPKERFRSKKAVLVYRVVIVLLFVTLLASFILPTVFAPSDTGDVRGGETSEVSQVGFILSNPFQYALILIWQMLRWLPQCFFGADCTTFMGHLVNGYTEFKGFWPVCLFVLTGAVLLDTAQSGQCGRTFGGNGTCEAGESSAAAVCENGAGTRNADTAHRNFHPLERLWIFLMTGASAVLIWTSMYVAFTEPGAREIAGVQGRYFIPLMFPLYLLLTVRKRRKLSSGAEARRKDQTMRQAAERSEACPAGACKVPKLASRGQICYHLTISISAVLLTATIWETVISRFCM